MTRFDSFGSCLKVVLYGIKVLAEQHYEPLDQREPSIVGSGPMRVEKAGWWWWVVRVTTSYITSDNISQSGTTYELQSPLVFIQLPAFGFRDLDL